MRNPNLFISYCCCLLGLFLNTQAQAQAVQCQNVTVTINPNLVATAPITAFVANYNPNASYSVSVRRYYASNNTHVWEPHYSTSTYYCGDIRTDSFRVVQVLGAQTTVCTGLFTVNDANGHCAATTQNIQCTQNANFDLYQGGMRPVSSYHLVSTPLGVTDEISVWHIGAGWSAFAQTDTARCGDIGRDSFIIRRSTAGQVGYCYGSFTVTDPSNYCGTVSPVACQTRTLQLNSNQFVTAQAAYFTTTVTANATYRISTYRNGAWTAYANSLNFECAQLGTNAIVLERVLNGVTTRCTTTVVIGDANNYCASNFGCRPFNINLTSGVNGSAVYVQNFVPTITTFPINTTFAYSYYSNGNWTSYSSVDSVYCSNLGTDSIRVRMSYNGGFYYCNTTLTVTDSANVCNPLSCRTASLTLTPNLSSVANATTFVNNPNANATYAISTYRNGTWTTFANSLNFECAHLGTQQIIVQQTINNNITRCTTGVYVSDPNNYCASPVTCASITANLGTAGAYNLYATALAANYSAYPNATYQVQLLSITNPPTSSNPSAALTFGCAHLGTQMVVLSRVLNGVTTRCTATVLVRDPSSYCLQTPLSCQAQTINLTPNMVAVASAANFSATTISGASYAISVYRNGTWGAYASTASFNCTQLGTYQVRLRRIVNGITSICNTTLLVTDANNLCATTPRLNCISQTVNLTPNNQATLLATSFVTGMIPSATYTISIQNSNGSWRTYRTTDVVTCADLGTHAIAIRQAYNGQIQTCTTSVIITNTAGTCNPLQCQPRVVYAGGSFMAGFFVATTAPNSTYVVGTNGASLQNSSANIQFACNQVGQTIPLVVYQTTIGGSTVSCTTYAIVRDSFNSCGACVNLSLRDTNYTCPTIYAPVCGCDSVTYRNACQAQYWYGVQSWTNGACRTANTSPLTVIDSIHNAGCDTAQGCTGSIALLISGGQAPYQVLWSGGNTSTYRTGLCAGWYYATVTDANGAIFRDTILVANTLGCVWAGDTDDNAMVNYLDILPISLVHGETGAMRPNASIAWRGQSAPDWNTTNPIVGLPNYKHIDSNGDGVINQLDMQAVIANFSRSYYRNGSEEGEIPFYIADVNVSKGARLSLPINLGTSAILGADVYGVAFSIEYDPTLVTAGSVSADFANSWLGTDLMTAYREDASRGVIEMVVARKDRMNITNYGEIGKLNLTIRDDILRDVMVRTMPLNITNARLIDNSNRTVGTTRPTGTVTINTVVGVNETTENAYALRVFPNPTQAVLNVEASNAIIEEIRIFSTTGRTLKTVHNVKTSLTQVDMSGFADGVYMIAVITDKGIRTERVQIQK